MVKIGPFPRYSIGFRELLDLSLIHVLSRALCVSLVWKIAILGLKSVNFCHFRSLNRHKNTYKAVKIAKETSAATPRPTRPKYTLVPEREPIENIKNQPTFLQLTAVASY